MQARRVRRAGRQAGGGKARGAACELGHAAATSHGNATKLARPFSSSPGSSWGPRQQPSRSQSGRRRRARRSQGRRHGRAAAGRQAGAVTRLDGIPGGANARPTVRSGLQAPVFSSQVVVSALPAPLLACWVAQGSMCAASTMPVRRMPTKAAGAAARLPRAGAAPRAACWTLQRTVVACMVDQGSLWGQCARRALGHPCQRGVEPMMISPFHSGTRCARTGALS